MIKITSLGGSGEDSRNCFWLRSDEHSILLDCGVRREIAEVSRVYPLLTEEIAKGLDAVIISHAHEDHTAALPYLYQLGYRGPVYASPDTLAAIPAFLKKWIAYVRNQAGTLPFDPGNAEKLRFVPVSELPFPVQTGRDGHAVGGLWFRFESEGHSILYTGDLTYDSFLLDADPLPKADVLIIDSAYAGRILNQGEQYVRLEKTARKVVKAGGKLLLPVPANGRGIDMSVSLGLCGLPLYVESNIIKNTAALLERTEWIRPFEMLAEDCYTAVNDTNRAEVLMAGTPGVFLFGDGMMTTAVSAEYFAAARDDSCSKVIVSGHSARGTLANQLLREDFRRENGILLSAEQLTIKVHNDEEDVLRLTERVRPKFVMLFHSREEACTSLVEKLTAAGITTVCAVGKTLELPE